MEPVIHVIQPGDTLWDVLEAYHGHVDADMIRHVADLNGSRTRPTSRWAQPVIIAWRPVGPPPQDAAPDAQPPPAPPAETPAPASPVPNTTARCGRGRRDLAADDVAARRRRSAGAERADPPVPPTDNRSPSATPSRHTVDRRPSDDDDGLFEWSPRSVWAAIPIGVLLAAGLAGMTRRLRARRLSRLEPGEQLVGSPAGGCGYRAGGVGRRPGSAAVDVAGPVADGHPVRPGAGRPAGGARRGARRRPDRGAVRRRRRRSRRRDGRRSTVALRGCTASSTWPRRRCGSWSPRRW